MMLNRAGRIVWLLLVLVAVPCLAQVESVVRIGVTVGDMDRSLVFYTGVLNFEIVSDSEVHGEAYEQLTGVFGLRCRIVQLKLGDAALELTEYLASPGRPVPPQSRSNDLWFQHIAIITSDMDRAYERLRRHRVRHASTGPQTLPDWNPNAGGIRAFYFHDPDGHVLEILQFPAGKGEDRWQNTDRLFLGIDHTAIVVADTDASLSFYRDLLGMRVAGGSENYGDEQAHLNNVKDARLRITTLRSNKGPGVELLQYLSPGPGRPYPNNALPNDLFHWQTVAVVDNVGALYSLFHEAGLSLLSDRPVVINGGETFLCRDPDGHAVQVIARSRP